MVDSISDSELGLINYNIYRCDINIITNNCLRGGVFSFQLGKIFHLSNYIPQSNVEHLVVQVNIGSLTFLIISIYFRYLFSNSPLLTYEYYMSSIETFLFQQPVHIFNFL